jgi:2-haloacid dehalogenase
MLFSSELLGVYMPNQEAYDRVLRLIDMKPEEVVKVAAHAWDLRGAKEAGMKTVYVRRWTDDIEEDMEVLRDEFDVFLEGMENLPAVIERLG